MKHEEIPGFVELRKALYHNRLKEKFAVDASERTEIINERTEIRHQIAKLLYEYNESQREQERKERKM